jgi:hypothetical protein
MRIEHSNAEQMRRDNANAEQTKILGLSIRVYVSGFDRIEA